MLKSFTIKNFKSFKDTVFKLSPFTLLIGANASGKTNAIEALQYLAWIITVGDEQKFDEFSKEFNFRGRKNSIKFSDSDNIKLIAIDEYDNKKLEITYIEDNAILDFQCHIDDKHFLNVKMATIPKFKREDFPEDFFENAKENQAVKIIEKIKKEFNQLTILDIIPQELRKYVFLDNTKLGKKGENASSILYHLCKDITKKEIILDFIQSLPEQEIIDIDFIKTERDEVMVKLIEKVGEKTKSFDAGLLSDGTLRVLAIIAFILSADKGSLLIIEEIDNGIHPARIKNFLEKIRTLAKEKEIQLLMTSHNPALLDAIPYDTLEDVVCCYRDKEEGDSRLVQLVDLHRYSQLVAQGTLGELLTQGIIEKFVHDKRTPEKIKQESLDWLDDFEKKLKEI